LNSSVCNQQFCTEESRQTNIHINMCFRQKQAFTTVFRYTILLFVPSTCSTY